MTDIKTVIFDWGGVLIEDREEFVRGAENFGMQAIQYTGFKTLLSYLRKKDIDI